VVATQVESDHLDGLTVELDIPPMPPGRRWEVQVHARPVAADDDPGSGLGGQVEIGDHVSMVAVPVLSGGAAVSSATDVPVRLVRS
jgi:hypothetical protein